MLLINTRPSERAAGLTQQLQAAQISVLELPLLELHAQPYSDELLRLYRQLDQAKIIVVVSPTAAQIGMQYLQQAEIILSRLADVQWVAVGKPLSRRWLVMVFKVMCLNLKLRKACCNYPC